MINRNEKIINYCRADNKMISYECPECSFFRRIDSEVHQYLNILYSDLDTAYLKESF